MNRNIALSMVGILTLSLVSMSSPAQARDDSASTAVSTISVSLSPFVSFGMATFQYCKDKTHFSNGKNSREVFRDFTRCLIQMIPNSFEGTTNGIKWTGRNLVSIPKATQGTSDGTTEGLSGAEQDALILAVQEDLMGVVGGAEPTALCEQFMEITREQLGQDLSVEQLAAETIRELEALRSEQ